LVIEAEKASPACFVTGVLSMPKDSTMRNHGLLIFRRWVEYIGMPNYETRFETPVNGERNKVTARFTAVVSAKVFLSSRLQAETALTLRNGARRVNHV
jgi:hypothetical protein